MGALHAGHLSLVNAARAKGASVVVLTIFVNPTQFNDPRDLAAYPRTLDADVALCSELGVNFVFAPSAAEMYPPGFETQVEVTSLTTVLEGAFRPGHFRGVTTVVAKLLALTAPAIAVFGQKDYQQWKVLERMVRDLNLRIDVVAADTRREPDGLAMSSRNARLSPADRTRALGIYQGLMAARAAFDAGERNAEALTGLARAPIAAAFDRVDYVAVVDPETLAPRAGQISDAVILVAAHLGETRLIDNLRLGRTLR